MGHCLCRSCWFKNRQLVRGCFGTEATSQTAFHISAQGRVQNIGKEHPAWTHRINSVLIGLSGSPASLCLIWIFHSPQGADADLKAEESTEVMYMGDLEYRCGKRTIPPKPNIPFSHGPAKLTRTTQTAMIKGDVSTRPRLIHLQ